MIDVTQLKQSGIGRSVQFRMEYAGREIRLTTGILRGWARTFLVVQVTRPTTRRDNIYQIEPASAQWEA